MDRNDWMKKRLTKHIELANSNLLNWTEKKLKGDAFEAFEWAEGAMTAAAELRVLPQVLRVLENSGWDAAFKMTMKQVVQKAMYRNASTSVASNLIKDMERSAWAHVARDFEENN